MSQYVTEIHVTEIHFEDVPKIAGVGLNVHPVGPSLTHVATCLNGDSFPRQLQSKPKGTAATLPTLGPARANGPWLRSQGPNENTQSSGSIHWFKA